MSPVLAPGRACRSADALSGKKYTVSGEELWDRGKSVVKCCKLVVHCPVNVVASVIQFGTRVQNSVIQWGGCV